MSGLLASGSLKEFFRHLLTDVTRRQNVDLNESTEFYVVNLLSEFADSTKLFQDVDGHAEQEPLAVLYHRALQQARDQRIHTLRRLGDVSLYRAGFFSPSLRSSAVGANYYIQMGGAAYGQVASMISASSFSDVYRELEEKFARIVDVLEEISARGMVSPGAQGALQVYEAWSRTGNDRLEQVLVEAGVLPKPKNGDLPN
jgi:hypothetical protein